MAIAHLFARPAFRSGHRPGPCMHMIRLPLWTTFRLTTYTPTFLSKRRFQAARTLLLDTQIYSFGDIKVLSEKPSHDRVLIDVREPAEYRAGYIPSAQNMPITSHPDALFLGPEEFEDRFGFPKPSSNQEVIFYCKAGVRSKAAAKFAEKGGYQKIGEYAGSWLDWEKQGGRSVK